LRVHEFESFGFECEASVPADGGATVARWVFLRDQSGKRQRIGECEASEFASGEFGMEELSPLIARWKRPCGVPCDVMTIDRWGDGFSEFTRLARQRPIRRNELRPASPLSGAGDGSGTAA